MHGKQFSKLLFLFTLFIFTLLFLNSCEKEAGQITAPDQQVQQQKNTALSTISNELKMAVFSDPHYYDPQMGISGAAFNLYVSMDRKMIAESEAILQATISKLLTADAEIILIPGDLTKDGEKQSHQKFAAYIAELEAAGKKVYVIPGNHDISNPHAAAYVGDEAVPVPSVTPEEFAMIYNDFGFSEALYHDPNSLTYIASPREGYWILAIDDCNYDNKFPELSMTAGKLSDASLQWIGEKLQMAKAEGITVVGMIHHGVVEHFPGMDQIFPEYLITDWRSVSSFLIDNGIKFMFSGHHHATDISKFEYNGSALFDIQTGSSVTWQCPYRLATYNSSLRRMDIDNEVITSISYDTHGLSFQAYAYNFLATGLPQLVVYQLMAMGADEATARAIEPLVTNTMIAYYHGDERNMKNPDINKGIAQMMSSADPLAQMLGQVLLGIWHDQTADNDVWIDGVKNKIMNKNLGAL
jgi:3',5'-cyclic AMP phosphodiesterase CpdA